MKINFQNKIIRIIFTVIVALEGASLVFDFSFAQIVNTPSVPRKLDVSAMILNSDNKIVTNGEYDVRLSLYQTDRTDNSVNEGTALWQETQKVTIYNGILHAFAGTVTALPSNVDFSTGEYYVGIKIGEDTEMVPRKRIGAVPLAIDAMSIGGATTGIGEGNILKLGAGGKIDIKNLPTGTSGNNLVTANNLPAETKITVSGQSYITASAHKLTLKQINLATNVTGILPVANGGTGISSYATGDILYASDASTISRRAIGNNGEVLTIVGGLPQWQPAAGTIDGSGAAGHITFWQDANTLTYDNVGNFFIDSATHRLGVGTVSPGQTLSVNGTFGIQSGNFATIFQTQAQAQNVTYTLPANYPIDNGYILTSTIGGNLSWSSPGAASLEMGGSINGGAVGGFVLFIDNTNKLAQDPSNFYWTNTLHRLGIGNSDPQFPLDVSGTIQASGFRVNSETVTDWTG
ncbi:MAG TPA: hypothetical protein VK255_04560, partial [Patescibacteria group bacterium]|nr:hypothetical protein [Patescibacteria group bacterium]